MSGKGRGGGWSVTLVTSTIRCDILSVNSFFSMYYNVLKLFCIQVRFRTCTVSYSPTLGRCPQDLYLSPTPSRMFWSCRPKISLPLLTLRVYHLGIHGQPKVRLLQFTGISENDNIIDCNKNDNIIDRIQSKGNFNISPLAPLWHSM